MITLDQARNAVLTLERGLDAAGVRVLATQLISVTALRVATEGPAFCEIAIRAAHAATEAQRHQLAIAKRLEAARVTLAEVEERDEREALMAHAEPLSDEEREALYCMRAHFVTASSGGEHVAAPVQQENFGVFIRAMAVGKKDPRTLQFLEPAPSGKVAFEIRRVVLGPLAKEYGSPKLFDAAKPAGAPVAVPFKLDSLAPAFQNPL